MKKYASAALPNEAMSRGTLTSRKTIAPNSASKTGKSGAVPPKRPRSTAAVPPPKLPARCGKARETADRTESPIAAIPTISRFNRALAVALDRARAMESRFSSPHEEFILSTPTVVVLKGDQTGQELLLEALRVLERSVIDLELAFVEYDLSLENRRATQNQVVFDAAEAMKANRLG